MTLGKGEEPTGKPDTYVHVGPGAGKGWLVRKGHKDATIASYRRKYQAVAFARAVAFSRGVDMIVHDLDGRATHYHRASLTYPTRLD